MHCFYSFKIYSEAPILEIKQLKHRISLDAITPTAFVWQETHAHETVTTIDNPSRNYI